MPALFTHHLFALDLAARQKAVFPFLSKHTSLLTVGAQGPDPFFFYGQFPFRKRKQTEKVNQIGSLLHHEDPAPLMLALVTQAQKMIQTHPEKEAIILTYLLGAISHYALDRTMHPYVFYRSGFDQQAELTPPYHADHARFESTMDRAFIQYFGLKKSTMHPKKTLGASQEALQVVSSLYAEAYPNFSIEPTIFFEAVRDMRSTYDFLYDDIGFKKSVWQLLAGIRSVPFGLSHPSQVSKKELEQILNLHHESWKDPATGKERHTSLLDLWASANLLMDAFASLIERIVRQGKKPELADFEALTAGIQYDGHLFTNRMKTFQSIYPSFKNKPTSL